MTSNNQIGNSGTVYVLKTNEELAPKVPGRKLLIEKYVYCPQIARFAAAT